MPSQGCCTKKQRTNRVISARTTRNDFARGSSVRIALALLSLVLCVHAGQAQEKLPDLKTVPLDTQSKDAIHAMRVDARGRLFAASRTALFVYEPNDQGSYANRQLLYQFPA